MNSSLMVLLMALLVISYNYEVAAMKQLSVDDNDSLLQLLSDSKGNFKNILVLFTASKDASGVSWCPDCNVAEPIIKKCLATYEVEHPDDSVQALFIKVFVGSIDAWKDQSNSFKKGQFKVRILPTLVKYGRSIKLEGGQLIDEELVNMLILE